MKTLLDQWMAARRVSTPLFAIQTPDPAATIATITEAANRSSRETPVIQWDVVRALSGLNKAGVKAVTRIMDGREPAVMTNLVETLSVLAMAKNDDPLLPLNSIVFIHNAHLFFEQEPVIQAIWNLRDPNKSTRRALVLLGPTIQLPPELANDVLVLDEPLPSAEQLTVIVQKNYTGGQRAAAEAAKADASISPPPDLDDDGKRRAVDAVCGLAAFPADQVSAMALTPTGLDYELLWSRKAQQIEQTPGLAVHRGAESFTTTGGLAQFQKFCRKFGEGPKPPRAVVLLDEMADALAGAGGGDLSGVSSEMHGTLLSEMQDRGYTGIIAVGPPGTGKTNCAKAAAALWGCPLIVFDFSGMKASLVGQSGARLRSALKTVYAISQGNAFFIGTGNAMGTVSPQLRRRFSMGVWFFDLPDPTERAGIWEIYRKLYKLPASEQLPKGADDGWTGAEIKQCCENAWLLNTSLTEAAKFIVPVARSAADSIKRLREQANGRFLSASHDGVYTYDEGAGTMMVAVSARVIDTGKKGEFDA